MITKLAPGEEITPGKLNQVIDALNAVRPGPYSLPQERTTLGTSVSVPRRPRHFYAIIKESEDRPRDVNGEVPDGEYEWAEVKLDVDGSFEEITEGDPWGLASHFEVTTGQLFNPAYELNDDRKVPVGEVVRMRPVEPIVEEPIYQLDDEGNRVLGDDGFPIVEEEKRGFLRRYVFGPAGGPTVKIVEIQPDGQPADKRYGTVNYDGVFDGQVVGFNPEQGGDLREGLYIPESEEGSRCWILALRFTTESMTIVTYTAINGTFEAGEKVEQENTGATGWFYKHVVGDTAIYIHKDPASPDFSGDAADVITGKSSEATATPNTVTTPQSTIEEEKLNLLPAHTHYIGLLIGTLTIGIEERPLYVIDEAPKLRQFELTEDLLQAADESWPIEMAAVFTDEPGTPEVIIYRPCEFEDDLSAYYPGIGRVGGSGHAGSRGWAKWSEVRKRWEFVSGSFKTVAMGIANDNMGIGDRGTIAIWWKTMAVAWGGISASGGTVEAYNMYYERVHIGCKLIVAYDRQENLWVIIDCERPVMVDGLGGVFEEEVGRFEFDDVVNATMNEPYFKLTAPADGRVVVEIISTPGVTQVFNAFPTQMVFENGILQAFTP